MELSGSGQEVVLEFVTAASGDPSTATDLDCPVNKETVTSEPLTDVTADDRHSVMSAVGDAVSSAAATTAEASVNRDVQLTTPLLSSSSAADARRSQKGFGLNQINCALHGFETLRLEMLSRLETVDGMNKDELSTAAEENVIIRRLLESLECGVQEMQANTVHICMPVQYNDFNLCICLSVFRKVSKFLGLSHSKYQVYALCSMVAV